MIGNGQLVPMEFADSQAQRASVIGHCSEALHAATHGMNDANRSCTLAFESHMPPER